MPTLKLKICRVFKERVHNMRVRDRCSLTLLTPTMQSLLGDFTQVVNLRGTARENEQIEHGLASLSRTRAILRDGMRAEEMS